MREELDAFHEAQNDARMLRMMHGKQPRRQDSNDWGDEELYKHDQTPIMYNYRREDSHDRYDGRGINLVKQGLEDCTDCTDIKNGYNQLREHPSSHVIDHTTHNPYVIKF